CMPQDRRQFLATTASAALGLSTLGGVIPTRAAATPRARPGSPLRILVLGGTSFIGPYQVEYALERGHEITLFNRGRTNPRLFRGLETLIGDRAGDVRALEGRQWDVVLDNSAQEPEWVELTGRVLRDNVRRYILVSTRSVYSDLSRVPSTADAPVYTIENTPVEPGQRRPYGLRKAPLRAGGTRGVRCACDHRASGAHHRARRRDGSLHVLAGAHRAWWRGSRPG